MKRIVLSLMLAGLLAGGAAAQGKMPAAGQYQIKGGSYMMNLEIEGANVVVVEPNKRSVYTPQPDGSFHVRNPTNGILYGIRVAGDGEIDAFKPDHPDAGATRLVLISSSAPAGEIDEKWEKLAEKYQERVVSDPANTQTWVACSAVAMKRSVSAKAEADRYAVQMASMLKQIAVDPARNPCADVFLAGTW